MEAPQSQPRRKRARVSEIGGTAAPGWPPEAVRATEQDTGSSNPTFASHQIERSHQVADAEALMNGYSAPHSQYPNPSPPLAHAPPDVVRLNTPSQAQQSHQHQQHQRPAGPIANTDQVLFYSGTSAAPPTAAAAVAAATPTVPPSYSIPGSWTNPNPTSSSNAMPPMPPQSPVPGGNLAPPPEGIYRTFEDLLTAVQRVAKEQGYGVVKLRASNYRDNKPTRYDLVCDRGGVKYNSTAKKRNPSTRKVDCPWRAKAVCEVQLGNQWRFAVQDSRHNHEPRLPASVPGQENTPIAQSIRSMTNKIDRIAHDMSQGFNRLEATFAARLDGIEKRLDSLEGGGAGGGRGPGILGGPGGTPNMGTPSMPSANMGGGGLGNGALTNGGMGNGGMGSGGMGSGAMGGGGMVDNRLSSIEARVSAMEHRAANGMEMNMMDEESRQLASMVM
ncbi:hypothetical protein QBC33DRAFT_447916 [Phialemonium atrogriseum]|uniref:FAR1 domain-containing protein n=1 Tax=Phialemonium atrogriseum TaxID=1093897 RepID=A0AAJ0C4X6_9PEZI|nr:uncharacterized protein QBC33DRAFT_447916 [Phialemonium atrogriseum]KAK1769068.1 hypothetical protein QBC33DRAFT_447916 [Phialemonium atrogriseum]